MPVFSTSHRMPGALTGVWKSTWMNGGGIVAILDWELVYFVFLMLHSITGMHSVKPVLQASASSLYDWEKYSNIPESTLQVFSLFQSTQRLHRAETLMKGDNVHLLSHMGLGSFPSRVVFTNAIKGGRKAIFSICNWIQFAHKRLFLLDGKQHKI